MSDKRMVEPSPEFDDWAALSRKFGHLSIAECYAGLEERDQLRAALAEARRMCQVTAKDCYDSEQEADALRERNARLEEGLKSARAECADYMETYPGCAALMEDVIFTLDALLASGSGEGQ